MQEYFLKLNFIIYIPDGIFYMSLYCFFFLNLSRQMRILFTASCWYWLVLGKKPGGYGMSGSVFPSSNTELPSSQVGCCVTGTGQHEGTSAACLPTRTGQWMRVVSAVSHLSDS